MLEAPISNINSMTPREIPIRAFDNYIAQIAKADLELERRRFNSDSSCVNIGECQLVDAPMFTLGAYSCYAGIAVRNSRLYLFHYKKSATLDKVSPQVLNSNYVLFGRAFPHSDHEHWLNGLRYSQLPVLPFKSINIYIDPTHELLLYSYGEAYLPDKYE